MILKNGIDIIDIRRIKKTLNRYGDRFIKKCFTNNEIIKSESRIKSVESYAKRYAAKEACAKALGTGLARGVFWKDIEVYNDKFGKPKIKLYKNALKFQKKLIKKLNISIEVSLTDETNYAIANVIIYEK
ncbi:holo-ACP synthase [Pelagibacterales bacterium SAG-MED31]|nr:holo-ACP synthase [Pelagibacterales bacterium SAG-MED31]